jgi:hypothetical protein
MAEKFKIKAPRPLITIQSRGRQKDTLGWYRPDGWKNDKKNVGEINICAEVLNKDPIETLIHEMVHYTNSYDKIIDCNSQQYHNKHFKDRAENYGLNVEKDGRRGWAYTKISPELKKSLDTFKIDYNIFKLYRNPKISIKAPTKMKKYRCNCTTVRCATELQATCNKCKQQFKETD